MKSSRRDFLKFAAAAALLPAVRGAGGNKTAPAAHPVRMGAPLFCSDEDPEAWALRARQLGYGAVYAPGCRLDDRERIDAVVTAAAQHDIVISEVGRWVNLMDRDPEKAKKNLDYVTEGLALADELDARCCVDIAGSMAEEPWFGPDPGNLTEEFFDRAVENARKIIDAVRPRRAKFAYEMSGWAYPYDVDSYLRLIAAIDRPQFGVHLDICNIVNSPQKFWGTTELINDVFDRLGGMLVSCHAKDLRWEAEKNIHFVECVCGEGSVDWGTALRRLATLPTDVPLMIEHMPGEAAYLRSRDNLKEFARENGVEIFGAEEQTL